MRSTLAGFISLVVVTLFAITVQASELDILTGSARGLLPNVAIVVDTSDSLSSFPVDRRFGNPELDNLMVFERGAGTSNVSQFLSSYNRQFAQCLTDQNGPRGIKAANNVGAVGSIEIEYLVKMDFLNDLARHAVCQSREQGGFNLAFMASAKNSGGQGFEGVFNARTESFGPDHGAFLLQDFVDTASPAGENTQLNNLFTVTGDDQSSATGLFRNRGANNFFIPCGEFGALESLFASYVLFSGGATPWTESPWPRGSSGPYPGQWASVPQACNSTNHTVLYADEVPLWDWHLNGSVQNLLNSFGATANVSAANNERDTELETTPIDELIRTLATEDLSSSAVGRQNIITHVISFNVPSGKVEENRLPPPPPTPARLPTTATPVDSFTPTPASGPITPVDSCLSCSAARWNRSSPAELRECKDIIGSWSERSGVLRYTYRSPAALPVTLAGTRTFPWLRSELTCPDSEPGNCTCQRAEILFPVANAAPGDAGRSLSLWISETPVRRYDSLSEGALAGGSVIVPLNQWDHCLTAEDAVSYAYPVLRDRQEYRHPTDPNRHRGRRDLCTLWQLERTGGTLSVPGNPEPVRRLKVIPPEPLEVPFEVTQTPQNMGPLSGSAATTTPVTTPPPTTPVTTPVKATAAGGSSVLESILDFSPTPPASFYEKVVQSPGRHEPVTRFDNMADAQARVFQQIVEYHEGIGGISPL